MIWRSHFQEARVVEAELNAALEEEKKLREELASLDKVAR